MAGIKIVGFLGAAPKISPELLPNTAGQIANNCKLYSGDLLPYPQPVIIGNTGRGVIKTLFALRDPDTNEKKWLSWETDVDIAVVSKIDKEEQRFYYSGDGAPKVSNYKLATSGTPPYPIGYYDLGLPVPEDSMVLTTSAATFTPKTTLSYARDTSNIVTIVTSEPHGLRTGNFVSISGFTYVNGTYSQSGTTITVTINNHGLSNGAQVTLVFTSGTVVNNTYTVTVTNATTNTFDVITTTSQTTSGNVRWDIRNLNAVNVEIIKVNDTTFTYFSPGPAIATTSSSAGKVELGGLTQARSYVFTWYTPWGEESIASKPSTELFIKEGTVVTVSNIPTAKPVGNNFVRGVRLYRMVSSASGSDYFLLSTLWFPTGLTSVQRTSNVSRVSLLHPHNLSVDDRFKISGCSVASFDITGGIVTDVIDDYTFEYTQTGADVANTVVGAGTLYHDVSENPPTTAARYWGDGGVYTFTDDFDSRYLFDTLATDNYDPPPEDLRGLTAIQNNILCGFVGNTLYFSEPDAPHAWPASYAVNLEHNIVGIAAISGSALVVTDSYPYLVSGSDPANGMSTARIDANFPCLSKNSIVTMGYGVVYSTHDGLAVYSTSSGPAIITKLLYNNDTWQTDIDPSTVVAEYYGDNYFASHATGAFIFEHDAKVGGFFVNTDYSFSASWYDPVDGIVYYTSGINGDIYEWDNLDQPPTTLEWKSKVIVTKDMINIGAARVVADYATTTTICDATTTTIWDATTTNWESDMMLWDAAVECVDVPADAANALTFRLWADKQLLFETQVVDSSVFRLPTGYRTDTFEVGVEGNIRVRAIHLAETPLGLREV